jgi:5-methyltetrahydrofolate--homocysteine methyltransferase
VSPTSATSNRCPRRRSGARVCCLTDPVKAPLGFINETMLFQVQWGFRKKGRSADEWKQHIDSEVRPIYRELVERCENEQILQPQAVYGYWPCNADGDEPGDLRAAGRAGRCGPSCNG